MMAHRKMKDYYKILGVRETASEEDIRARWIELVRKFHPDGMSDGAVEDETMKEINEAYQVLKHSSTRVAYDLKMAYHPKKRVLPFKRVILLPGVLVVSLVLGFIYLQRSQVGHPPNPIASPAIHPIGINVNSPSHAPNNPDVAHVHMAASSPIEKKVQTVQAESPSLVLTEEEVRQFFATYAERYSQKDISGFLSLFSARAVQNGREGFDEIKKMYSEFFDQSEQLRYHLEDMRIRIYKEALISRIFFKNVAEVVARYEIEQISKKGGKKKVWRGDISWVLIRENGALKVLYLHYQHQKSRRPM